MDKSPAQVQALPAVPASSALRYLPWLVTLLLTLVLFRDTAAAMVTIWWRSETYTHAFLVAPLSAWLVWRRRAAWQHEPVSGSGWWLLPLALACLLWLMGGLASVNAASQLALVAMVVLSVPAVLGWAITRHIIFPLLFLFFCVPIGEFLTDPMISATADFTVAALRLTGVPVYREGMQFVIPSGNWSVVEACSGVRYLIASFMVGTLFAYLNYNTWQRRLAFVVVSLLTPVLANWLRAYMIVMLGHLSGNTLAVGADHLVYGWVFFGLVIMLMFWIGGRFAEPELPDAARAASAAALTSARSGAWWVTAGALLLLGGTQALQWRLYAGGPGAAKPALTLPEQLAGGWVADGKALSTWEPQYRAASATAARTYRLGDDKVAVWVGFYRNQDDSSKLVTSTNRLVDPESREWLLVPQAVRTVAVAGAGQAMRSAQLRTPVDPKSSPLQRLNVLYLYRVGGQLTVSDARAKLALAWQRLLGRSDDSAVVFFYALADDDGDKRRQMLERFVDQHAATLVDAVDATAPRR